jgi:hypothetical protein
MLSIFGDARPASHSRTPTARYSRPARIAKHLEQPATDSPLTTPASPARIAMAARIDLQALQRQLDSFHTKFQHWAHRTVATAEGLRDQHLARLREFQGVTHFPRHVAGGTRATLQQHVAQQRSAA